MRTNAGGWLIALAFAVMLVGGLSLADNVSPSLLNQGLRSGSVPVSQVAGWVAMTTDTDGAHGPLLAEADSGVVVASVVVAPSLITRTDQNTVVVGGNGTAFQVRFRYPTAATGVTGPTVQVFGQKLDGTWQRLTDAGGLHLQSLSVDTVNDVRDGTNSYTQPVTLDAAGCYRVIAAINTVASGTGLTGCAIQGTFY